MHTSKSTTAAQKANDKAQILGKGWGTQINGTLSYVLGDVPKLTNEEKDRITREFFQDGSRHLDDIDVSADSSLPGLSSVLRIRGRVTLHPSTNLRGRECPLYMVDSIQSQQNGEEPINFANMLGEPDQAD